MPDPNCPLCGPAAPNQSAGSILGAYARAQRQTAGLYQAEAEALNKENQSLRSELKTTLDALHALVAPRSISASDLNLVRAPLEIEAKTDTEDDQPI